MELPVDRGCGDVVLPLERRRLLPALPGVLVACGLVFCLRAHGAEETEPVALRLENLLVTPAHNPSVVVVVKNRLPGSYQGTVSVEVPAGWSLVPASQDVTLAAGQVQRLQYLVKRGASAQSNSYRLSASATGMGATVIHRQDVSAASAPYFKPAIDGDADDWLDAIPVSWATGAKTTTVRTYWNRRRFSLLVEVQEAELIGPDKPSTSRGFDAVQVALSPQGATTGTLPEERTKRWEFLLVSASEEGPGRCYQLAEPGMKLSECQHPRDLAGLLYDDAQVAVRRRQDVTYYECSIPFRPMSDQIRPSEGREFCLSVLVHDPDDTGIRDWGEGAGLWPSERNRLAWSNWPGAVWGDQPPLDNKTPWGLCSSKY